MFERRVLNSRAVRSAVIATLALAASGCINLAPRYQRPEMPVEPEWHSPSETPGAQQQEGNAAATLAWREFFQSEKLRGVIDLALQNNRDLRIAALNVERTQALYRIQRAERVPNVDASVALRRERLPDAFLASSAGISQTYTASVGASFELDLFGRIHNLSQAALESYFAQESTQRSVRISLIGQIAQAYITLAVDQALHQLAIDTEKAQSDWFSLTQERHRLGAVSSLELSQSETTVESARADVARYEGNIAQDIDALTFLVGSSLPQELMPDANEVQTPLLSPIPVGLPSQVLLERPDIVAAEHGLRAANANIGAARAAFFPTISLTGSQGYISPELSGLFGSQNDTWSFSPAVSLPIFQGGRLRANADVAHVDRDIAVARYEQ
ncbi:MAG: efflux transporter outer membrane subunit, partial [Povalibacter sp.]